MVYPNLSRSIQLYLTVYVCIWLSSGSNSIQMYPQMSLCIEVFPEDEMYPDVSRCIQMYFSVICGCSHVSKCIRSSWEVHMYSGVSSSIQLYWNIFFFFSVNYKSGTCLKNLEFLFSSEKVSKYQENLGLV